MKDFLGNPLAIGDKVVVISQAKGTDIANFEKATVAGFPGWKQPRVELTFEGGWQQMKSPHKLVKAAW